MTAVNRTILYSYFLTGDRPTQQQFANLIDSSLNLIETSSQAIISNVSALGTLSVGGTFDVSGVATFQSDVTVSGNLTVNGSFSPPGNLTVSSLTVTGTTSAQNINTSGILSVTGTTNPIGGIVGKTDGSNAASGIVGEIIESTVLVSSAIQLTDNNPNNVTSIALTAGDWDIWGSVHSNNDVGTLMTAFICSISTISSALPTAPNGGAYVGWQGTGIAGNNEQFPVGMRRISVSTSTNTYLTAYARFTVSACMAYGYMGARRIR